MGVLRLLLLWVAVTGAGCGSEEASRSAGGGLAGSMATEEDGQLVVSNNDTGQECSLPNVTQACSCGDSVAGRQVCGLGRTWGQCTCLDSESESVAVLSGSDPPANKGEASFDWLRTAPGTGGGSCRPGHYGGVLDGLYNAPSAFTAPVPIVSVDVTGAPGFQIDLAKSGNGEFLTVTGGGLNGVALAIFPFEADFTDGVLDCSTGILRARIVNGSYVVFFDGFYGGKVMYQFEGELVARYDPATNSLVDGRWSVTEGAVPHPDISPDMPPPIFPPAQAGGTGTWSAQWQNY